RHDQVRTLAATADRAGDSWLLPAHHRHQPDRPEPTESALGAAPALAGALPNLRCPEGVALEPASARPWHAGAPARLLDDPVHDRAVSGWGHAWSVGRLHQALVLARPGAAAGVGPFQRPPRSAVRLSDHGVVEPPRPNRVHPSVPAAGPRAD